MAITTLVLGFTGEGKSYSIKNLNPEDTGIIQITSKPLPFRNNQDFAKRIRVSCDFMDIQRALLQAKSSVIVIDDFQYLIGLHNQAFTRNEMRRVMKILIGHHRHGMGFVLRVVPLLPQFIQQTHGRSSEFMTLLYMMPPSLQIPHQLQGVYNHKPKWPVNNPICCHNRNAGR